MHLPVRCQYQQRILNSAISFISGHAPVIDPKGLVIFNHQVARRLCAHSRVMNWSHHMRQILRLWARPGVTLGAPATMVPTLRRAGTVSAQWSSHALPADAMSLPSSPGTPAGGARTADQGTGQ